MQQRWCLYLPGIPVLTVSILCEEVPDNMQVILDIISDI